jgi:hypothetical protein
MEILFSGLAAAVPCLMIGGFAALVITLIVYSIMKARQRREALAKLAAEWGFQFYPTDPWDLPARYNQFELFDSGHSRHASNILTGQIDGRTVVVLDYSYKTGSGKHQTTHLYQAAVMQLPILAARMRMRPEGVLDRVASWVGHEDLDFESDEFSRRYYITSDDRKFAYDIFHTRLIEYLLKCGQAPLLEMQGPLLVIYDTQAGIENFRRLLEIGRQIIDSIPDYVRTARGTGAQTGGPPA